jgi:hypothetical protein
MQYKQQKESETKRDPRRDHQSYDDNMSPDGQIKQIMANFNKEKDNFNAKLKNLKDKLSNLSLSPAR